MLKLVWDQLLDSCHCIRGTTLSYTGAIFEGLKLQSHGCAQIEVF